MSGAVGGPSKDWGRKAEEALVRKWDDMQLSGWAPDSQDQSRNEKQREKQARFEKTIREEDRQRRNEENPHHKGKEQHGFEEQYHKMEEILRKRDKKLNKKDEELHKRAVELGRREEEQRRMADSQLRKDGEAKQIKDANEDARRDAQHKRTVDNLRTADQMTAILRTEKDSAVKNQHYYRPTPGQTQFTYPPSYSQPAWASTSRGMPERVDVLPAAAPSSANSPTSETNGNNPDNGWFTAGGRRKMTKFPASRSILIRRGTGETVEPEGRRDEGIPPGNPPFIHPGGGRKFRKSQILVPVDRFDDPEGAPIMTVFPP